MQMVFFSRSFCFMTRPPALGLGRVISLLASKKTLKCIDIERDGEAERRRDRDRETERQRDGQRDRDGEKIIKPPQSATNCVDIKSK